MSSDFDSGGFDSNSTSGNDSGDAVNTTAGSDAANVTGGDVAVEESVSDITVSVNDDNDGNLGKPDTSVSVIEAAPPSVSVSDAPQFVECDFEDIVGAKGIEGLIDNLNGAINGIKENGESTEAEKAEAIKANVNDTMRNIGLSNLSPEEKVTAMRAVYDKLPEDARNNIYVPEDVKFLNPEKPFNDAGEPQYTWADNLGFEGKPQACKLEPGQIIDRYGDGNGTYVCEVKNGIPQSYESRALPYAENPDMYHQYEITKDLSGFKSDIENLSVEDIVKIETQRDLAKPEGERRTPEQIQEDSAYRYAAIISEVEDTALKMHAAADENNWQSEFKEGELAPMSGKIKESFSVEDENGNVKKQGGGEQICLPASVDTLVYMGYMKEK